MSTFLLVLSLISGSYTAFKLANFFKALYLILTPGHDLRKRYQAKSGATPYALITGASDGVGKEFSLMLAKKGFNLLLVGRNQEKLAEVVRQCQEAGAPAVKTVLLDLAASDYETIRASISAAVDGLDVTLLINNAGMAMDTLRVCELDPQDQVAAARSISVNVTAFTAVAAGALPRIVATATRGGIINVSSGSAVFGLAYSAVYAGTKGYNRAFSLSLSAEMAALKVDSLALTPLFFSSGMVKMRKQFFLESAAAVASAALAALGRRREAVGTFKHELLVFLLQSLPSVFANSTQASMDRARRAILKARNRE